jgi:hypothetical protein
VFRYLLLSIILLASLLASPAPAEAQTAEPELGAQAIDSDSPTDRVGLVDPATGTWHLRGRGGEINSFLYGNPGDFPFVGDWDCDGVDTPGLYRQSDGFAYLRNSNTEGVADIRFFFGNPGDIPLAGDFNGDGCDTLSIYRASEAQIYVINELGSNDGGLGAAEFSYIFGNPGDKPFVGDFDGDGIDTLGLHRESTGFVYFRQTHTQGNADAEFFFGDPADRLVAGDWGVVNGVDTPAIFRPFDSTFYFRHTNTQGNADETLTFGADTYLPVAGVWNPPCDQNVTMHQDQCLALAQLFRSTNGYAWVEKAGWLGGNPCTWQGITCSGPNVVSILLDENNLVGTLPAAHLSAFTALRVFDLNGNALSGGLPAQLATLPLQTLHVGENQFSGAVPAGIWTRSSLQVLDLSENNFTGGLPGAFNLPALQLLELSGNGFTGGIPGALWNLTTLTILDLAENQFTGTIPAAVSNLAGLTQLDLGGNRLTGAIPAQIGSLGTQLADLDLSENNMSGAIPIEITQLTGLVGPGSLELRGNGCFTAATPEPRTFVAARDPLWADGCP